mmetsp:Transcript_11983/g.21200  ORF Transcript_11983/g.21200 Transcript_11983/m.21200 type:complete len:129 (-) Transcript_11983:103-489(-)
MGCALVVIIMLAFRSKGSVSCGAQHRCRTPAMRRALWFLELLLTSMFMAKACFLTPTKLPLKCPSSAFSVALSATFAAVPASSAALDFQELDTNTRIFLGGSLLLASMFFHTVVAPVLQKLYYENEKI